MSRKSLHLIGSLSFVAAGVLFLISLDCASAFVLNGTVYDVNGTALSSANVSVIVRNSQNWAQVNYTSTLSNGSGWFSLGLDDNASLMFQPTLTHNSTVGSTIYTDFVGQSMPALPMFEMSHLTNMKFYLKPAGTINITAIAANGSLIPFGYSIKDTSLGYPISSSFNVSRNGTVAYVPSDRNYSLMVYPAQGANDMFVPVSFSWNNFSSANSYTINQSATNATNYNATTKTLNKQFNTTQAFARINGAIDGSGIGISGWLSGTVIPYLTEPGNMIFLSMGILPFNASRWVNNTDPTSADNYTFTNASGLWMGNYSITVPYAPAETVNYVFFATARNGSDFYGAFRSANINTSQLTLNFTMRGLLGTNATINMSGAMGGITGISTKLQTFSLVNATGNASLSQVSAHIETTVDYSSYNAAEITFMSDISQTGSSNFSVPLINVTGIKEMNIYSMNFAPKRVEKTVAQIQSSNLIPLSSFNPGDIDGGVAAANINIALYISNSTCDVPSPPGECLITSPQNMDPTSDDKFNPMSAIFGGGKISFRMGTGNIKVHYVNVDMMASGPPDALFDDSTNTSATTGDTFGAAMRFGSGGPTIYDYLLVSVPYSETAGSGLNDANPVNISIPYLYDDSWTIIWNTTANGTGAGSLAGNYSRYSAKQSEWGILMNSNNTCMTNVSWLNTTYPCYINTTANEIWVRLPHFSGAGPSVSGSKVAAAVTTVTSSAAAAAAAGGGGAPATSYSTISAKSTSDLVKSFMDYNKQCYVAPAELLGVVGAVDAFPTSEAEVAALNPILFTPVKELTGDVYALAADLAKEKYRGKVVSKAVVARGDLNPDSIAAIAYAKVLKAPVLLVETDSIPKATENAIAALGVKSVVVIGGTVAVSDSVKAALPSAVRIGEANREETAVKIAEMLMKETTVNTVVITDGQNPSLNAVAAAVKYNAPVVYVSGDTIPEVTKNFLTANKFSRIVFAGVSTAVEDAVKAL